MRYFAILALLLLALPAHAQDGLVTYKSLSPEVALDLARAALASCRERGYQIAVAVVDRFGVTQVVLRDRFAGAHTVPTATGKAWTAVTFRTNTGELVAVSQPGMPQAGLRALPGVASSAAAWWSRPAARWSAASGSRARRAARRTRPAPGPGSRRCGTNRVLTALCRLAPAQKSWSTLR